ncbi:MAG: hypothetical protein JXR29_11155 [Methylothermaceae bacterium]|nr:hypothetical protein [Methylothermaceae bacterium]
MCHHRKQIKAVATEIEAYLTRHPHAADTVEGIRDWWLSPGCRSLVVIECALEWMTRHGVLDKQKLPDGRVIFRKKSRPGPD